MQKNSFRQKQKLVEILTERKGEQSATLQLKKIHGYTVSGCAMAMRVERFAGLERAGYEALVLLAHSSKRLVDFPGLAFDNLSQPWISTVLSTQSWVQ